MELGLVCMLSVNVSEGQRRIMELSYGYCSVCGWQQVWNFEVRAESPGKFILSKLQKVAKV
jgi:hypothetical protein